MATEILLGQQRAMPRIKQEIAIQEYHRLAGLYERIHAGLENEASALCLPERADEAEEIQTHDEQEIRKV